MFLSYLFLPKAPYRALGIEPKMCQTARRVQCVTHYDSLAQLKDHLSDIVCQILGKFSCLKITPERPIMEYRYGTGLL